MFEFLKRGKAKKIQNEYFKMLNGYTPIFRSFGGSIYEMDLTRSAIHSFATHISKLKPIVGGSNNQVFERMLQYSPNQYQDTTKFLYQLATIYQVENTAFIVKELGINGINGFHAISPTRCRLVKENEEIYLTYEHFGIKKAVEFSNVGVLSKFIYKDGLFGESNNPLAPTLEIMNINNQGIVEGVKNSASIRFFAKLGQVLNPTDLEKERKRLTESQLSVKNNGGMIMLDNKYEDFKQIISKPYTVDEGQMNHIKNNVFSYLNTNEKIIQNTYSSDEWNAYYEGAIEPFAIQLSLVMTNLVFSETEKAFNNNIIFTANRLQYLSNAEKLNTVTQLFDRGFLTHNQGLEIFNMAGIGDEGDKRYIRKEYAESNYIDEYKGVEKIENNREDEEQTI